jgi:hypothetical protein
MCSLIAHVEEGRIVKIEAIDQPFTATCLRQGDARRRPSTARAAGRCASAARRGKFAPVT